MVMFIRKKSNYLHKSVLPRAGLIHGVFLGVFVVFFWSMIHVGYQTQQHNAGKDGRRNKKRDI